MGWTIRSLGLVMAIAVSAAAAPLAQAAGSAQAGAAKALDLSSLPRPERQQREWPMALAGRAERCLYPKLSCGSFTTRRASILTGLMPPQGRRPLRAGHRGSGGLFLIPDAARPRGRARLLAGGTKALPHGRSRTTAPGLHLLSWSDRPWGALRWLPAAARAARGVCDPAPVDSNSLRTLATHGMARARAQAVWTIRSCTPSPAC